MAIAHQLFLTPDPKISYQNTAATRLFHGSTSNHLIICNRGVPVCRNQNKLGNLPQPHLFTCSIRLPFSTTNATWLTKCSHTPEMDFRKPNTKGLLEPTMDNHIYPLPLTTCLPLVPPLTPPSPVDRYILPPYVRLPNHHMSPS